MIAELPGASSLYDVFGEISILALCARSTRYLYALFRWVLSSVETCGHVCVFIIVHLGFTSLVTLVYPSFHFVWFQEASCSCNVLMFSVCV